MIRNQQATYWFPTGPGAWGVPSWSTPQLITVRWQDEQKLIRTKDGQEAMSAATIYTGQPIDPQGRLQRGVVMGNPTDTAYEPKAVSEHVSVHGETDHWRVYV